MMASNRFLEVHKLTAEFEGGWSNHPADPGGKTMYGVTERVYHAWLKSKKRKLKPVKQIKREEAEELYYEEYWLRAGCDKLANGVDRMVYDAAVNSGVSKSRQWLMKSIGGTDKETVQRLAAIRMAFLRRLKTWKTFGKGWTRRVTAMEKQALKDVLLPKPKAVPPAVVKPVPVQKPTPPVTPAPTPATPPAVKLTDRGIFAAIAAFFSSIFGRKK